MAQYKTPGVYVEEKSMLPPSVAGVATAVPAFIGFTQFAGKKSIQPISSLLEYETVFGGGKAITFEKGKVNDKTKAAEKGKVKGQEYAMYDSMRLFFDNGGGNCYVVSIGTYASSVSAKAYTDAITLLEQQSDVTLLVFPDAATLLGSAAELASVQMQALKHCAKVGGRFAILDLKPGKDGALKDDLLAFRNGVTDALCYGAAYYPYLKTTYAKDIAFDQVVAALPETVEGTADEQAAYAALLAKAKDIIALPETDPAKQLKINAIVPQIPGYAEALADMQDKACVIPPSGAIAGIFASTDSRVGVWQAPANIGVASVKDLTMHISDLQQEEMNVDPETAKSVNAIRYFKGKGILVWGSRTLDGGSNEWRYVPVRRLFTYVEQSVKLSTSWAVFQPNDSNTWIKIKCQIANFLSTLWRDGALAGASSDEAFFVEVGKGVTMTEDDINNGYLRVRIGLAAVRPAEFIVLEFSHKVQE